MGWVPGAQVCGAEKASVLGLFSDTVPEELQRYRWCFHVSSFLYHLCLRGSVWEAGEWLL